MLQIHSDLKELLASLSVFQHPEAVAAYQKAYLRFRGLVADAAENNEIYQEWARRFLLNVSDET